MSPTRNAARRAGRRFAPGQLDHPRRDVEADDAGAARRERERDVAGAGREVERRRARRRRREIDQPTLPASILPVRQHDGDEVVAIGNRGKERADVAAFAVWRRDAVPQPTWVQWIISLHAPVEHRRELPQGHLSGTVGAAGRRAPRVDGSGRGGAERHAGHRDDDGQGAGRIGAGRVRTVQRRAADAPPARSWRCSCCAAIGSSSCSSCR